MPIRAFSIALCLTLAAFAPPSPATGGATAVPATTGRVTGAVKIHKGSAEGRLKDDRSGVVVYLDFEPDPEHAPPTAVHEIRQVEKAFTPAISAVVVGTEVGFPNDDKVFHNVFSLSKTKRFDLGLYKSGTTRTVVLSRPGVIDIYCNIHPEMWAKIVVAPNRHFAVTGPDGRFELRDVPPGTYPVVAWQTRGEPAQGEVTVTAGGVATLELVLVETPQSTIHTRKDGTPYGRYQ